MSEYTPEELSRLPFEDRLKYFESQRVIDVTNGFRHVVKNADELWNFYWHMFEGREQSRFPILGFGERKTEGGSEEKINEIFMLGGDNDRFAHIEIVRATGQNEEDILYASGMEGLASDDDVPHLRLTMSKAGVYGIKAGDVVKIQLGRDTDIHIPTVTTVARQGGHEFLERIFGGMDGVEVVTPQGWKAKKNN